MNFIEIMESILPIGPTKWDQVWEQHSVVFPDRELNTLRRKYTTLHRKKIPTGDPHMPDEVRMAKHCKYGISQKAELGDATGEYDMMQEDDRADDDPEEGVPLEDRCDQHPPAVKRRLNLVPIPPNASNLNATPCAQNNRGNLSPRRTKVNKKQYFFALMAMQMQNEAAQRAHEAREQAASRAQMQYMILGLSTAYLGSIQSQKKIKG